VRQLCQLRDGGIGGQAGFFVAQHHALPSL
jgi:hypothetical protein